MKDTEISDKIRSLRQRRGWTQEELAARAGLSREVVAKIERGGTARMETYHALARALGVRTLMFVSPQDPEPVADPHRDTALAQIRAVINPPVCADGGLLFPAVEDAEPNLDVLAGAADALAGHYARGTYNELASLLPAVVQSAHQHVQALDGEEKVRAHRVRADILVSAGRYLIQVREHDLALMALRDALTDALTADDPVFAAAVVPVQSWALLRQSRFEEVETLCERTADEVEPTKLSKATPDELGVWGHLLLWASAAAARNNRPEEAEDYLRAAAAAAARLGREAEVTGRRSFGPLTVAMKEVENTLIAGRPDRALQLAEQLPRDVGLTYPLAVHRHRIDVARAQVLLGDAEAATATLAELRSAVPGWLRHQQSAREVAEDILAARTRMPSAEQRDLADFLRVPM